MSAARMEGGVFTRRGGWSKLVNIAVPVVGVIAVLLLAFLASCGIMLGGGEG